MTAIGNTATPKSEPQSLADFLPYLMNRIASGINQNLSDKLRSRGLTFQHWRVLLVLAVNGDRNISALAEETVIPQSTLSRLIDRMQRNGLVVRRGGVVDSRVVEVSLTDCGRATLRDVLPFADEEYDRIVRGISECEIANFVEVLQRMLRNLRG